MEIEVSVVMPCLNEAETLDKCINKARQAFIKNDISGEIVVADNGSNDGSQEIAKENGARLICVQKKGYGSALRGGIEAAKGKFIVMGDADDSYDFSTIYPFIEKLRQGYDLVMGCRFPRGGGSILKGAMPWKNRYIGNPILSYTGRLFFGSKITDFHCGLRAFTKDAYKKMALETPGMEFASEMVVKAQLSKLRITEVPIKLFPDGRARQPHLNPWKDGWRHLRFMLLYSPTYLFMIPGAVLLFIGLTLLIGTTFVEINIGYPFGLLETRSTILGSILTLVGFNILSLGLFAKVYAMEQLNIGISKDIKLFIEYFTLERGIVFGSVIIITGLIVNAYVVYQWFIRDYTLDLPLLTRLTVWGLTLMVMGSQIISSSFFISIPRITSGK